MLTALRPSESIYDGKKLYKKISVINIKKKAKNISKKVYLPKMIGYESLEQNLAKNITSLSITFKNSSKNNTKIKYISNRNNLINNEIIERKNALSENNIKLPELQNKKVQKKIKYNWLYLKYEGQDNNNEIRKKIYIKIHPQKVIHSLYKIYNDGKDIIINNIEKNINKMVDKYTTMSNFNNNVSTNIDTNENNYFNEIINPTENKYILLTQENEQIKNMVKIKNIFLENIINNVINHTVEIINKKNQIILKKDIENEFQKQISLLKKYLLKESEIRNKKKESVKSQKIKRNIILKKYNKIILSSMEQDEYTINKINELNNYEKIDKALVDKNNEAIKLFRNKLGIKNHKSIHNLYQNIMSYKCEYSNSSIEKINKKKINKLKDNNSDKSIKIKYFYKKYNNLKKEININKENNDYIFELSPNIKFVDFNDIKDEINLTNKNNSIKNNNNIFFLIMPNETISNKIKFQDTKTQKFSNIFYEANKKYNKKEFSKRKINKRMKNLDILKELGEKLHKKIKIKISRNKLNKNIIETNTEYIDKENSSGYYIENKTENKNIFTETNSSLYSDIPSDLSISYSEIKKEKEQQINRIKELLEKNTKNKRNKFNFDEFIFSQNDEKEKKEKIITKKEIFTNKSKLIENDKKLIENGKKSKNININISNIFIQNKIKKSKKLFKFKLIDDDACNTTKMQQIKNIKENKKSIFQQTDINNEKNKNFEENIIKSKNSSKEVVQLIKKGTAKDIIAPTKIEKDIRKTKKRKITKKRNDTDISKTEIKENDSNVNAPYYRLMILINKNLNIPGKVNKIQTNLLFKSNSLNDIINSKCEISFENNNELNKSFSFIETKNDKKLILLRPILKHCLDKRNKDIKVLKNTIYRLFSLSSNIIKDSNSGKENEVENKKIKRKNFISFDYYGNYESYTNHKKLIDKYFNKNIKSEEKFFYYDDNDLLLGSKDAIKPKKFKKKINKNFGLKGFRQLMMEMKEEDKDSQSLWENFEKNKKLENEKIKEIIKKAKEKEKKMREENENRFKNFKSKINFLKSMNDEQLKYDAIRVIFKIKPSKEKLDILNKVKRINEYKNFIKNNEENKKETNKSILKNLFFQPNCIFHSDKIFISN